MKKILQKMWSITTQKTALLSLGFCLCLAANVFAATITSNASGDWATGATWVGGVAPISTDDVIIASGHTITLPTGTNRTCNSLTVNGTTASGVAGTPNLTVTTTLTINNTAATSFTNAGQVIVNGATTIATGSTWQIGGQFTSKGNVTINGQLKGTVVATPRTWLIQGSSPRIEVNGAGTAGNGTLGGTLPTITDGEGLRILLDHTNTLLFTSTSGTPTTNIVRFHTNTDNAVDQNTDIDINMNINSVATTVYALSLQQGNNGIAAKTLTIKEGKTVALTKAGTALHGVTGTAPLPVPSASQGNMTYVIENNATLDVSAGRMYLYTTSFTGSTQQLSINVQAGGTLKTGTQVYLMRNQSTQLVNINVAAGGTVDATTMTATSSNVSNGNYSWITLASSTALFKRTLTGATATPFWVGTSTTSYTPVTINNAGTSVATVSVVNGVPSGASAAHSVSKTWDISLASAPASIDLTFGFNAEYGASYNPMTAGGTYVFHKGATWEQIGTGATPGAGTGTTYSVAYTGLVPSSYSPFVIGALTVLPIELQSVTAKPIGAANLITWTTASEKDNAEFQIERSNNGTNFTSIGTVKGSGTTSTERVYNFNDETPLSMSYYRLRQTDLNGTSTVSKVVSVAREKGGSVRFYPSLTRGELTVEVPNNAPISISISDITGRTLLTKMVTGTEKLDVSSLSNGTYFLSLTNAGVRTTEKFVKQ